MNALQNVSWHSLFVQQQKIEAGKKAAAAAKARAEAEAAKAKNE